MQDKKFLCGVMNTAFQTLFTAVTTAADSRPRATQFRASGQFSQSLLRSHHQPKHAGLLQTYLW